MGKGKPRKYPEKRQNNKPLLCPRYEEGKNYVYCEGGDVGAAEICHGNPHNCIKTFYKKCAILKNDSNKIHCGVRREE